MKKTKTIYWTINIIFCVLMLMDGFGGVTQQHEGQEAFRQLGYPVYLMIIIGSAKILGAAAMLQDKFATLKEWAFAGFAFNFTGAAVSWAFVGGTLLFICIPIFMLLLLFVLYALWKKLP